MLNFSIFGEHAFVSSRKLRRSKAYLYRTSTSGPCKQVARLYSTSKLRRPSAVHLRATW